MHIFKKTYSYQNAIDILTSQGKFYINLGLERIKAVLEILGNPQDKLKIIHVAGTNGKGSVCAMLSSILAQAENLCTRKQETVNSKWINTQKIKGHCQEQSSALIHEISSQFTVHSSLKNPTIKVGLFTSPHVFDYTERIKINGIEIEKETFAKNLIEIVKIADENNIHLTEFEILTAVAFDYFAQNNVDVVVLETGLGGRLDATNVIAENLCSIITHIDFDHTERLGDIIEKIAFEKAGIIKENCPVIISPNNSGFRVIEEVAALKKAPLMLASAAPDNSLSDVCSLKGVYQKENLALVLAAVNELRKKGFEISDEALQTGLQKVKHPCRFEYLRDENIIIDGAHNPNGTKALRESLDYYFPEQGFTFVFGCLRNKDYKQMMKSLFNEQDEIYFYHFENNNSCSYEELATVCEFKSKPFSQFQKNNDTITVICGSLYMVRELLPKISEK